MKLWLRLVVKSVESEDIEESKREKTASKKCEGLRNFCNEHVRLGDVERFCPFLKYCGQVLY